MVRSVCSQDLRAIDAGRCGGIRAERPAVQHHNPQPPGSWGADPKGSGGRIDRRGDEHLCNLAAAKQARGGGPLRRLLARFRRR